MSWGINSIKRGINSIKLPYRQPQPGMIANLPDPEQVAVVASDEQKQAAAIRRGQSGFAAFADKQLGGAGFKASTSDGKAGFVVQSGPFSGMTKDSAMAQLRNQYAGMSPEQKRAYEARGTGEDLASDYSGKVASFGGGGMSGQNMKANSSLGGGSGLDYLAANRITGDALKQAESNVAATGDRNRAASFLPTPGGAYDQALQKSFSRQAALAVPGAKEIGTFTPKQMADFETKQSAGPANRIAAADKSIQSIVDQFSKDADSLVAKSAVPAAPSLSIPEAPTPPTASADAAASAKLASGQEYLRSQRQQNLGAMTNGTPGNPSTSMSSVDAGELERLRKKFLPKP
ncbi:MAG: hypothetical protein KA004_05190 [Verrucomicrobiales bacterium]|nr:hypothetical protein [Verrucomicrobiales bacterium]